ncbi:hypothetical protein Ct9H90mP29_09340 [bacterium]|nr:MAG: hypothetical protein Ct9H90mP29_09340 [bacterium]
MDGHDIFIKLVTKMLPSITRNYNIPFTSRGSGSDSFYWEVFLFVKGNLLLFRLAKDFNPDLFLSFASPYASHVSRYQKTSYCFHRY